MKKVAYITLIAAFIFGVQPQEAFSTENSAIEMEKDGTGSVKISFDQNSEILSLFLTTKEKEKARIAVYQNGVAVAKQTLVLTGRETNAEIDLSGMSRGYYVVKIESSSIEFKEGFRKK